MGLREALRLSAQKTHFYGILKILRQKNQEGVKLRTQFGHKNADLENDYFLSSLFLTLVVKRFVLEIDNKPSDACSSLNCNS